MGVKSFRTKNQNERRILHKAQSKGCLITALKIFASCKRSAASGCGRVTDHPFNETRGRRPGRIEGAGAILSEEAMGGPLLTTGVGR